jgi:hypothetical protein
MLFCLDCDPYHPFVRNLESSGTFGLVSQGSADNPSRSPTPASAVADDAVLFQGGAIGSPASAQPLNEINHYVATNFYDGAPSGISIRDIKVNPDHSVTATFTAPAVSDPCSDVTCGSMEQCLPSGALAGNCAALEVSVPDAGTLTTGRVAASGCSSSGGSGLAGILLLAGLAGSALSRKRPD